jgi:REP element-mobilizing transposase RayT
MCLNAAGELAAMLWNEMPVRFPAIELDAFVIMPNHLHGIIVLPDRAIVGAPLVGARSDGSTAIGDIVGAYKSIFTVEYIQGVKDCRWPAFDRRVWQRNYYEHVIRDETDLARIRCYIDENPLRWEFDDENPRRERTAQESGRKGRPYAAG